MSESDLTVLVVKGAPGRPSEDAVTEGNFAEVDRVRERVFRTKWFALAPPKPEDFG